MDKQMLLDEIKAAMKSGDKVRRDILRQVNNEVVNIEVNERREVSEADVNAMLKRVIKQTGETLEASIKAANDDARTQLLQQKVQILESYLPQQVSGEQLDALIAQVVQETQASSLKQLGQVMGALTQKTGGNFDKAAAAAKLKQILA